MEWFKKTIMGNATDKEERRDLEIMAGSQKPTSVTLSWENCQMTLESKDVKYSLVHRDVNTDVIKEVPECTKLPWHKIADRESYQKVTGLSPGARYKFSLVPTDKTKGTTHTKLFTMPGKLKDVDIPELDPEKIRANIKLLMQDMRRANILLMGETGVGKSSFLNTVYTALTSADNMDRPPGEIRAAGDFDTTVSKATIPYKVSPESDIIIYDAPGFDRNHNLWTPENIFDLLNGKDLPAIGKESSSSELETTESKTEEMSVNARSQESHRIDVVVYVVNVQELRLMELETKEKRNNAAVERVEMVYNAILSPKFGTVQPPAYHIVASHIDLRLPALDCEEVLVSEALTNIKKDVQRLTHALPKNIHPVKNYINEQKRDAGVELLALSAARMILYAASDNQAARKNNKA